MVEPVNSSKGLHEAIASFKKDPLPPSTAKIHELFQKSMKENTLTLGDRLSIKQEVINLQQHIEQRETGGYKGIRGKLYRGCYKVASIAYNFFSFGVIKASSTIATEMVDSTKSKREAFIKAHTPPKNPDVTEAFKSHPLAFKGFSSEGKSYKMGAMEYKDDNYIETVHEIRPQEHAFELFNRSTGALPRSKSEGDLESVIGSQGEDEGRIERSKSTGDLKGNQPIDVEAKGQVITLTDASHRDLQRSAFQFFNGPILSKTGENTDTRVGDIVEKLLDLGVDAEKIPSFTSLMNLDLLDNTSKYTDSMMGKNVNDSQIIPGKQEVLYCINIEGNKLVVTAKVQREVDLYENDNGNTNLGSLSFEIKILLPLSKMRSKEPITQDDLEVTHTYGAFEPSQFGGSERLAPKASSISSEKPKGWMSKVYDALFDSAQVKAYKAISDEAVPPGLRNHPLESQEATLTKSYKVPVLGAGNEITLKDVNPKKDAWGDFRAERTSLQTVHEVEISGGAFTEIGRNKVQIGDQLFQTSEIKDKSEEQRAVAKREVVEGVVLCLKEKEGLGIHQKHIPGLCNIIGQNLVARISEYSRGATAPEQEVNYHPITDVSYEFKKVGTCLEVIAYGEVTYNTDEGKKLGTQKIEVKVSLPLSKLQSGEELTEDDFQVTHTYEAFKKSG